MDSTVALIRRWTTQEVARTNAAHASATLRRRRLEMEEVDAYVAQLAQERRDADTARVEGRVPEQRTSSAHR
jgi:hypothetical protein